MNSSVRYDKYISVDNCKTHINWYMGGPYINWYMGMNRKLRMTLSNIYGAVTMFQSLEL